MHAGPHGLSHLAALLVLAGLVVSGCGDGAADHRPDATPAAEHGAPSPSPTPRASARFAWAREQVLRRISGRPIRVDGKTVRVDPTTVTCGGVGPAAARVRGEDAWTRFRCVEPAFPANAVAGPDAIFFLEPRGARRFKVTDSHFTRY